MEKYEIISQIIKKILATINQSIVSSYTNLNYYSCNYLDKIIIDIPQKNIEHIVKNLRLNKIEQNKISNIRIKVKFINNCTLVLEIFLPKEITFLRENIIIESSLITDKNILNKDIKMTVETNIATDSGLQYKYSYTYTITLLDLITLSKEEYIDKFFDDFSKLCGIILYSLIFNDLSVILKEINKHSKLVNILNSITCTNNYNEKQL